MFRTYSFYFKLKSIVCIDATDDATALIISNRGFSFFVSWRFTIPITFAALRSILYQQKWIIHARYAEDLWWLTVEISTVIRIFLSIWCVLALINDLKWHCSRFTFGGCLRFCLTHHKIRLCLGIFSRLNNFGHTHGMIKIVFLLSYSKSESPINEFSIRVSNYCDAHFVTKNSIYFEMKKEKKWSFHFAE